MIDKTKVEEYLDLSIEIEDAANKLLEWAEKVPEIIVPTYSVLSFEYIEDNKLWYTGYENYCGYSEDVGFILPLNLLYSEENRQAYVNKIKEEKRKKEERKKQIEKEKKVKRQKELFEYYQELKKEFEGKE